mgnify:CR=1 FL=1
MNKDITINLLLSAFIGVLVWAASPYVVGTIEPWDSESSYYVLSILISGVVLGTYSQKQIWSFGVGTFIGQLLYIVIFLPLGPLIIVGSVLLAGSGLICYLGALITKAVKHHAFP